MDDIVWQRHVDTQLATQRRLIDAGEFGNPDEARSSDADRFRTGLGLDHGLLHHRFASFAVDVEHIHAATTRTVNRAPYRVRNIMIFPVEEHLGCASVDRLRNLTGRGFLQEFHSHLEEPDALTEALNDFQGLIQVRYVQGYY